MTEKTARKSTAKFVYSEEIKQREAALKEEQEKLKALKEQERARKSREPAMHRAAFAYLLKQAEVKAEQGDASTLNYLNAALNAVREDVEKRSDKRAEAARKSRAKSSSKTSVDAPADDATASTAPIETPHASDGATSDQS